MQQLASIVQTCGPFNVVCYVMLWCLASSVWLLFSTHLERSLWAVLSPVSTRTLITWAKTFLEDRGPQDGNFPSNRSVLVLQRKECSGCFNNTMAWQDAAAAKRLVSDMPCRVQAAEREKNTTTTTRSVWKSSWEQVWLKENLKYSAGHPRMCFYATKYCLSIKSCTFLCSIGN